MKHVSNNILKSGSSWFRNYFAKSFAYFFSFSFRWHNWGGAACHATNLSRIVPTLLDTWGAFMEISCMAVQSVKRLSIAKTISKCTFWWCIKSLPKRLTCSGIQFVTSLLMTVVLVGSKNQQWYRKVVINISTAFW